MGKPITQSRNEIKGLPGPHRLLPRPTWHKVLADEEAGARRRRPRMQEKISYEPIGVVGNISAWNYP